MHASIVVPAEADLVRIATLAGAPEPERRSYDGERLTVQGVAQDALERAAAEVGEAPSRVPEIHGLFAERVAAGLPVAGQAGAIQLDPDSRRELATAVLMSGLGAWPEGGFWRLSDNTNLAIEAAQVTRLGVAAAAYYQSLFAARSVLLDAARAGQAVDLSAWPVVEAFDPAG